MMLTRILTGAIALLVTMPALAADPAEETDMARTDERVLSSLSAAAVIDAKLLPAARASVAKQARTWHRGARVRLGSLPACLPGQKAVACVMTEPRLAELPDPARCAKRDNAGGGLGPRQTPAAR